MDTQEFLTQLAERLAAHQVLGDPVERDGVTLVPVAEFRGGGGIGGRSGRRPGEGNGGFGLVARPVGAWVLRDGEVRWRPAVDPVRYLPLVVAGIVVPVVGALVRGRRLR